MKYARCALVVVLLSLSGCLQPSVTDVRSVSLSGRWQYSAMQNDGTGGTLRGTLVISQQSGASFQGSLDVTETSGATGEIRAVAGAVSGAAPATTAIEFDAFLEVGISQWRAIGARYRNMVSSTARGEISTRSLIVGFSG